MALKQKMQTAIDENFTPNRNSTQTSEYT